MEQIEDEYKIDGKGLNKGSDKNNLEYNL